MKLARCLRNVGTVYLSKSTCIYENLAFEEWLFRNHDLQQNGEAVLLWSNTPAVVIGRHQNPFLEANLRYCWENSIQVARRNSGGGAVYHDLGNLNISFLTNQLNHRRSQNLNLLVDFFNKRFGSTLLAHTTRDDIVFANTESKISGTAARISHGRAYHHLTLLIDAPLDVLKTSLSSNLEEIIETNATRSIKAKSVGFLAQRIPDISVSDAQSIVVDAFSSRFNTINIVNFCWDKTNDSQYVGVVDIKRELYNEDWIFGRTPRFKLMIYCSSREELFEVLVEKGRVKESVNPQFPIDAPFYHSYMESKYC